MEEGVQRFISSFEERFGSLLLSAVQSRPGFYTDYFKVYTDKPKLEFSDWDLECRLHPGADSAENLLQIDSFIRSYEGLGNVGHLLSGSEKYAGLGQHNLRWAKSIHYMGVLLRGAQPPFIDITLHGMSKASIRQAFPEGHDEEFESWIRLTAWRKLRNSKFSTERSTEYEEFVDTYKIPICDGRMEELGDNPAVFFERSLPKDKYDLVVKILKTPGRDATTK